MHLLKFISMGLLILVIVLGLYMNLLYFLLKRRRVIVPGNPISLGVIKETIARSQHPRHISRLFHLKKMYLLHWICFYTSILFILGIIAYQYVSN